MTQRLWKIKRTILFLLVPMHPLYQNLAYPIFLDQDFDEIDCLHDFFFFFNTLFGLLFLHTYLLARGHFPFNLIILCFPGSLLAMVLNCPE